MQARCQAWPFCHRNQTWARRYTSQAMKPEHKNGRAASAEVNGRQAAQANGSVYRSAKTGRYVTVTAPKIKNAKKRSATVGRATSRLKTAVTVDLPRSRRSK